MNDNALDAMIYAWMVMKEKEESSMEGIYVGKVKRSVINKDNVNLLFIDHRQDIHHLSDVIDYEDTAYCLVPTNDIIINNDELLKLRDEVKELNEAKDKIVELEQKVRDERKWCDYWRHTYYAAEKVASAVGVSIKIDGIESQHNSAKVVVQNDKAEELEKQMVETFADLEKRLAATKSEGTYWRHTFNRAVAQAEQKGVYIGVSGNDEENNAGVVIVDNGKANELESQIVQMEDANQKLRQRISAADERIEDLESQIVKIADANKVVVQRLDAANKEIGTLDKKLCRYKHDNDFKAEAVIAERDRGDHWKRQYDDLAEYLDNTCKDLVATGKKVGVKIKFKGDKSDSNTGDFDITNEKALELMVNVSNTKHEYNKKWQAMTEALKAKGVEVIYMGEQDGKPIVDVKIPGWDSDKEWVTTFSKRVAELLAYKFGLESERDELKEQCDILRKDSVVKRQQCLKLTEDLNALKKECGRLISELAELKSETVAGVRYEFRPNCLTIIYTKCDGSKQTISMDSSEAIDANSISCGTVPKCSSCAHYMHNPSRFAHDWCYMPIPKEGGAGYIRKLNKEESEGPACSDFKARKE